MRILADENIETLVIARLRADGYAVEAVAQQTPGAKDVAILERAVRENVLLLTADRDFGDYIFRDRHAAPAAGVVLYRLNDAYKEAQRAQIVGDAFQRYSSTFAGHFTTIEEYKVRSRPLP